MATISGSVIFDANRSATIDAGDSGIAQVSVVLQDTASLKEITVLTDSSGNYSFTDVPPGNYIVVESYGKSGPTGTVSFLGAAVGPVPVGINPPISAVTSPPATATNLDSLTPNTLKVTVVASDVPNQNFLDGPVIYVPISTILDSCSTVGSTNYITAADNGTFGSFPAGTATNTGDPNNPPYPGVTPGFTYATPNQFPRTPSDGYYTLQNIMDNNFYVNADAWWKLADHTTGDETGRMMVVNGFNTGAIIFQQTLSVTPNTYYLFTAWIANILRLAGYAKPALGVTILGSTGNVLYNQDLTNTLAPNLGMPEWHQIGTGFNTGNDSSITVIFTSQGDAAQGNDYVIDDIKLNDITIPTFTPVKSANKAYADVGSIVTYTVTLPNTCSLPLTSVFFQDTIPQGLSFVPGSVTINTAPAPSASPAAGFSVPDIPGGSAAVITFNAKVDSIPNPNPTLNTATMNYSYSPVQGGIPLPYTQTTNRVPVVVNNATLASTKTVDKSYANFGDILTYTLVYTNTGNVPANNVVITDPIPSGTSFVLGSLSVSVPSTGSNPASGITLNGPINPGSSVTVTYQVQVGTAIPTPNPIPNIGTANYTYTVDPNVPNGVSNTGNTNQVDTQVNHGILTSTKTASPAYVKIGDTITYTIVTTNTGSIPVSSVVLTDPIPNGTSYVSGSISVNKPFTGTPLTTVNLTNPLAVGESATITYQVLVNAFPVPNPIPNTGSFTFNYIVNPNNPTPTSGSSITNTPTTPVNTAILNSLKSVNKQIANVGDVLTYTLVYKNTGNVPADNVVIMDPTPAGTTFVSGSITSTAPFTGSNPASGITLSGPIAPGGTVTITYQVLVNTIPNPNPIPNSASATFNYTINPNNPDGGSGSTTTPVVNTQVNHADLTSPGNFTKTADKTNANVGDTITYTLVVKNTGNVPANNVFITDPIPSGTTFVAGSVTSTVPFTGNSPVSGITLTSPIVPGGSATITYKVKVGSTLPIPNPIPNTGTVSYTYTVDPNNPNGASGTGNTNTVNTQVNIADLTSPGNFTKTADKTNVNIGDTITYTLVVKNTGNTSANNVVITDPIPSGTTFVAGSITSTAPFTGTSPASGITLTNPIAPGGSVTITYQVKVGSTLPVPNPIPNTGAVNYTYTADPNNPNGASNSGNTNTVNTQVNIADLTSPGNFVKSTDKTNAAIGDTITYTLVVKNTGNVSANNVVITDPIPNGTSFIAGSITATVPFTGTSPVSGITLTSPIPAGGSVTITYQVKVGSTLPSPNPIPNTGTVNYTYTADPNNPNGASNSGRTNTVNTQVNNADLTSPGNFTKIADKQFANVGDVITYTIKATNTGNVPANNVVITDIPPNGTTFVAGSITSTAPFTGSNPSTGITLTNPIPAGGSVTLTYKVTVTSVPNPNPIVNTADVAYTFTSNPNNPNGSKVTGTTPPADTTVNTADIKSPGNFTKTADKQFANVGDIVTYTVKATNTGNVPANNVVITDVLPNGATFVAGSVTATAPFTGTSPVSGITLTNPILAGGSVTLTYKVTITSIPNPNPMQNTANIAYSYTVDPSNPDGVKATNTTAPANTEVNNADLTSPGNFTKSVDKTNAGIGDTITYTLVVKNTGNVPANNVVISDPIPSGTTFVAGSITSTAPFTGSSPASGITLTSPIAPGGSVTITYQVKVGSTLPIPNPIPNTGAVNYSYTVDPSKPNGVSNSGNTNTVNTKVNHADLTSPGNFTKTADKTNANVGDTITYTLVVKNTGNVPANNVVITDPIPNGTTFVAGSITSTAPFTGSSPASGITLTNPIAPSGSVTITYQVKVGSTLPVPNPIPNTGAVNYTYTADPNNPNGVKDSGNTNTVNTQVNIADLKSPGNFIKSVDKTFDKVGDVITYTLTLKNTGNVPANNVVVKDPIPNGTSLVPGSVVVSVPSSGSNPATGITLTNPINPGQTVTITYQIVVNVIPVPNPIPNTASVTYSYTADPNNPNGVNDSANSNTVNTQINNADLTSPGNFTKTADKQFANVGDVITYTVKAKNTGNVPANNVVITDTLPNGTSFISGSITSTAPFTGNDPSTGITLTNPIPAGGSVTLTYQVTVTSVPNPNPIVNTAEVNYTFTSDPNNPNGSKGNTITPPAKTQINNADLTSPGNFVKSTDKTNAAIGDTITYTLVVKNTGNVPANNVVITDTIPNGTTFVAGSITSTAPFTGSSPASGITLTNPIAPGGSVTLTYQVKVGSALPVPNPIPNTGTVNYTYTVDPSNPNSAKNSGNTNTVNTQVNNADLKSPGNFTKTANKAFAIPGDVITYTIKATNTGNVPANNVVITDVPPNGTTFISGSITSTAPFTGSDPSTGITLTNPIAPGGSVTLTYQVKVGGTLPVPNPIENTADINYKFTSDPNNPNGQSAAGTTNPPAETQVNIADLKSPGNFTKTVDKAFDKVGDVLTYTLTLKNTGNVPANNVVVKDTIPNGTSLVPGSVVVSVPSSGSNPATGITLTNPINPGQTVTITYQIVVNVIPVPNPIPNTGTVNYTYTANPSNPNGVSDTANSNTVTTQINNADLSAPGNFTKTADKQYADIGDIITYTLKVKNTGNVPANNVVITDTIPNGANFVSGSIVSSSPFTGSSPVTGITLTNPIAPNQTVTITYEVKVTSIPTPNPIANIANVAYTFTSDPNNPNGSSGSGSTPPANTTVKHANIQSPGNFTKTADKLFANIGDTILYTIQAKNTGNAPADNVVITDTLPSGTAFVIGSITSTAAFLGSNPASGITLINPIAPGQTVTITYKATVISIPTPNPIENTANINYSYTVDPANPDGVNATNTTPPATTLINNADLTSPGNFIKTVDKAFADVGDIITYTLVVKNSGNVPANNVIVTDALPNGTTLVPGSVSANVPFIGTDITSGITLTNPIAPGGSVTITYKVKVITLPNPNPIQNVGSINYTYTVDPSKPNGAKGGGNTAPVNTQINHADLQSPGSFVKTVDKAFVSIGDVITYTIKAKNTGSVPANNVIITDTIPSGTTFVAGSITSTAPFSGSNPATGITLTNPIAAGATVTITYKVQVGNVLPTPNPVVNVANTAYTYTVNPTNPDGASATSSTPPVSTEVNYADLTSPGNFTKTVDKAFADIGDIVTYTLTIKNTGNVPANNIVVTDTLPTGTTLVPGSVTASVPISGSNPATGITLTTPLAAGATATITYKVTVTSMPNPNPIKNTASLTYTYTVDPANPNGNSNSGTTPIPATTQVNHADLESPGNFVKTANKAFSGIGEVVVYTITAKNTGNVAANNAFIKDVLPPGLSFIPGSITSSLPYTGSDITTGITLTAPINAGQSATITFKAMVNSIPNPNTVENNASINYTYTVDPANPNSGSGSKSAPPVDLTINAADLLSPGNFIKSTTTTSSDIGDIIPYTLTIKNTGNVPANNVVVTDTLPTGTILVPGSIAASVPFTGSDLTNGVTLTNPIGPNSSVTISFSIKVVSVTTTPISNTASIKYTYTSDPSNPNGSSNSGNSNKVDVPFNHGEINQNNAIKTADKTQTTPGDTVTYTVKLTNTGTVPVNNVVLNDVLPQTVQFITGSVTIDGTTVPSQDPNSGITVPIINAGKTSTITFKVKVLSNTPNPLVNTGVVNYSYISNPNNPPINKKTNTTTATVTILYPNLNIVKSENRAGAVVGDVINYVITAKNLGDMDLTNIVIKDVLDPSLSYSDNLTINGVPSTQDITTGVNIGTLLIGDTKTISFNATVLSIPANKVINNTATGTFSYVVSDNSFNGTSTGNTVQATVFNPSSSMTKVADKNIVKVGDTLTYTITYTNTGDIALNNVIITDTLPASLQVVSITLDGSPISGNLASGINIGTVNIGASATMKVTVKAINSSNGSVKNAVSSSASAITDPNQKPTTVTSNTTDNTGVTVFNPSLSLVKSTDKTFVIVGDTIHYTIVATNNGDILLKDIFIYDPLAASLEFVNGSINIDGVPYPNLIMSKGVNIGSLDINQSKTITFDVKLISANITPVSNVSYATFEFTLPGYPTQSMNTSSNIATVIPEVANIDIVKTSDKDFVILGDTIEYTVTLKNNGTVPTETVIFTDSLPSGTELIQGTFEVNGVVVSSVDLSQGVNIDSMAVGQTDIITYTIRVVNPNCSMELINSVALNFRYVLPDGTSGLIATDPTSTSSVKVNLGISNFKQFSVEDTLIIPPQKPSIESINNVRGYVEIVDCHVVKTNSGISVENQSITGYKLIIHGVLNEVVEYTACDEIQSAHSAHYNVNFSTFVVLPANYSENSKLEIDPVIEDIYFKESDCRKVFTNTTLLLNVKILSC